jgi:hypothetical protein
MPFQAWPDRGDTFDIDTIVKMYREGFAGAVKDPAADEQLDDAIRSSGGQVLGCDAASAFADSGAGKLVLPFVYVLQVFPDCWPASAQQRGDCVSHDARNACLLTLACEIVEGKPDEVTGIVEGPPEIPEAGRRDGVLSTEFKYWWRGYNGDGWSCAAAMQVAIRRGMMARKPYPELNIDLTRYSGRLAGMYGARQPPANIAEKGRLRHARTSTRLQSFEEVRDFLHNGYGISTCGGEGYSNQRDENGVSPRRGSWAHAMALIGADDRDEIKRIYGEPLVLVLNSWGPSWNRGPRRIRGTDIDIPLGSFWAKWSDVRRRWMAAVGSINGWPARKLPDLGFDPSILG